MTELHADGVTATPSAIVAEIRNTSCSSLGADTQPRCVSPTRRAQR